jgi:hypothetical protein
MATTDDDEIELPLPTGRLRLPISALMRTTGLTREEILAAVDTIASLNLADLRKRASVDSRSLKLLQCCIATT